MLGNIEDWSNAGASEAFIVKAKPERLCEIKNEVRNILLARCIVKSTASSIRGKLLNLASTRPYRTGRCNLQSLGAIADGHQHGWSRALEFELLFVLDELDAVHERAYPLIANPSGGAR